MSYSTIISKKTKKSVNVGINMKCAFYEIFEMYLR